MQRATIFAIVLSMTALFPRPPLLCAPPCSQIAESEAAATQTQCDSIGMQMDVQDDVSHLSPSCQATITCCILSQVSRTESQLRSDENPLPIARGSYTAEAGTLLHDNETISVFKSQDLSPPRLQSRLCTFLI